MPRRDESEFEAKRSRIIDGALQVFAAKGYEQATNRDIAEASGIASPGLIYHYFRDKADLLRQVIEQRVPLLQLIAHPEEFSTLAPREALTRFGAAYLRILDNPAAVLMMRLVVTEATRRPHVAKLFNELGPNRVFRFLGAYLDDQMRRGALRRTDPTLAARCFMGSLVAFVLARVLLRQPDALDTDPERMLAAAVDLFLEGLKP